MWLRQLLLSTSKTREPAVIPRIIVPIRIEPCDSDRWTPWEATKNAINCPAEISLQAIRWPPKNNVDNTILKRSIIKLALFSDRGRRL